MDGARGRTRTGTALRPRDFKSLASTNFATQAAGITDNHHPAMLAVIAPKLGASQPPKSGWLGCGKQSEARPAFITLRVMNGG